MARSGRREYILDCERPPLPAVRRGEKKRMIPRASSPGRGEEEDSLRRENSAAAARSRDTLTDTPRRRRKEHDRDRDRDSTSSKEKQRRSETRLVGEDGKIKKRHRRRSKSREGEREKDSPRSSTAARERREGGKLEKKVSMMVPEMERRVSTSLETPRKSSYPSFSKAHSREAVGSREDVAAGVTGVKGTPFTPEATEISGMEREREKVQRPKSTPAPARAPPSPPLTAESPARSGSGGSLRKTTEGGKRDLKEGRSMEAPPIGVNSHSAKNSRSNLSLRKDARLGESEVSSMPGAFPEDERKSTPTSGYRRTVSTGSQPASIITQTTNSEHSEHSERTNTDSDATSIAPGQKRPERPRVKTTDDASPPSITDSQPKTPTPLEQTFPIHSKPPMKTPIIDVIGANAYNSNHIYGLDPKTPMTAMPMPMGMTMPPPPPPPPPPPAQSTPTVPRVDYLLKHGGLGNLIPRRLVPQQPVQAYNMYTSPAIGSIAPIEEYAKIFGSLHKRLDDYLHVLRSSGSLAVATGYKSVARRLLDKLSQVFARDISSQRCDCVVCKTTPQPSLSDEEDSGVSWGEILEFVSGRREYPQWPPFTIQADDAGLGISAAGVSSTTAPMQKLDIDVPEEYKDHYIRQNQKTKKAVQSWLAQQPEFPSSPPDEADEDTLMFAMMTKLDPHARNLFIALMHGQQSISSSRAPTPAERPSQSSTALQRTKKALQRLYRLDKLPRDCEAAMYLLSNPHLHGMMATLAEVNEAEWEILVSGRFDGFLWSGAEAPFPPSASQYNSPIASRMPSRGGALNPHSRNTTPFSGVSQQSRAAQTTPFSPLRNIVSPTDSFGGQSQAGQLFPSRGPTPGLHGLAAPPPVQLDEDTEVAVLAEVERNLFNDMERFEDAFEILHSRAELVRQLLRERSAGLSMQSQLRRGSNASELDARLGTPASGITDFEGEEEDDGLGDMASLAPDDSASQISSARRVKRERRERRTPAVVKEEDESLFEEFHGHGAREKEARKHGSGRRSKY